jgi:ABC-2 type transport system permease protein
MNGIFFFMVLNYYANPDAFGRSFEVPPSEFVTGNWITFFALCLLCPALTMRLLAEESSTGTLEMLLTAPVTDAQVALSKWLGALTYFVLMLVAMTIYLLVLRAFASEWDWGPILGGFLGLLLVGALFLSIGLFASSITDNQVVAFIVAVLPNLVLFFISVLQNNVDAEWLRQTLATVDIWNMQKEFVKGVLHWKALAFYVSSTFLFLFLAVRGVESHTWR